MTSRIKELAKKIIFRYTDLAKPKYHYCVEPIQLAEIVKGIDSVVKPGKELCIVEIGVARGMTTRFVAEHITLQGYKAAYYCIDTFASFTKEDIDFEVNERGKTPDELLGFSYNDYGVWKKNFTEFPFVNPIQSDCSQFDFSTIKPVDFCFLDVDLYLPTKNVLNNIWDNMSPNGLIMVDDILNNHNWDGAYQALTEFVKDRGVEYKLIGNKCGMLRKPSASFT